MAEKESDLMQNMMAHVAERSLREARTQDGVSISAKHWLELGPRAYVSLEVENRREKPLDLEGLTMQQFRFGGFGKLKRKEIQPLETIVSCEFSQISQKETSPCVLSFERPTDWNKKDRLSVALALSGTQSIELILPKTLGRR